MIMNAIPPEHLKKLIRDVVPESPDAVGWELLLLQLLLGDLTIREKSPVQLGPVVTNEPRFVHIERTCEVI
jgi:hypothetical protein